MKTMFKMTLCLTMALAVSSAYGAIGDVWDLSDALLASVDPNDLGNGAVNQNPITITDATWEFHASIGSNYTIPTGTPMASFNNELPTQGEGWGVNHVCLVSYTSADGSNTNYQVGEVGGHGQTGATWTANVDGLFVINYGAWNARTAKQGRGVGLDLSVAGVLEDQLLPSAANEALYPDGANAYAGAPLVVNLTAGEKVSILATANDWTGLSLTITQLDPSAQSDLTISADPAYVNTMLPYAGGPVAQPTSVAIGIDAPRYVDCPNNREVLVFDHWEEVANATIADTNAQNTTVTIGSPIASEIKAVYVPGGVCGDECHSDVEDLVQDCIINYLDFALLEAQWQVDNSVQ